MVGGCRQLCLPFLQGGENSYAANPGDIHERGWSGTTNAAEPPARNRVSTCTAGCLSDHHLRTASRMPAPVSGSGSSRGNLYAGIVPIGRCSAATRSCPRSYSSICCQSNDCQPFTPERAHQ